MQKEAGELKKILTESVQRNRAPGLLFSGGLDTAVLAVINPKVTGITVSLQDNAEDIYYSGLLSKRLNFRQVLRKVDIDEALEAVPEVIRILRSFDPALPNDLAVYFGLKKAKELGIFEVATGDASDELFGGYSFMQGLADLDGYIRRIAKAMSYSSNDIGQSLGIKIHQPFIDKAVVDFALGISRELKIREDNGAVWGKWILRKAFEGVLPEEIAWQSKRPIEYGSGMNRLREIISSKIPDEEFQEKKRLYPVKFMNKEHLYYYEVYRKVVGFIPAPKETEKLCPGCGAGLKIDAFHCKVCGYTCKLKEVNKVEKKERKAKKNVIAYRKKCKANGTGLSHYILLDKK